MRLIDLQELSDEHAVGGDICDLWNKEKIKKYCSAHGFYGHKKPYV